MFLVGHAAVGAIIVSATGITNPAAAFGIGWLSHYLADFFPHGDEEIGEWTKKGNELRRLLSVVAIDGVILLGVSAAYIFTNGFSWIIAAAIVGSTIPDFMWGFEMLFHRRLFGPHEHIHKRNHNFFHIHLPWKIGVLAQLVVTAMLWWTLIGA